ncbi:hypothetical protein SYNPS1DRAFT_22916 [Syncephalis pseudoplumigaleata]|uniref:Uncharacterized protein n=1 Tax=Syncephalis pseudoplumigaleata TaxID=1712513 RepID=A0A4P9YYL1_9FUNG|nr:hypothetical protein SYNPS1DRAFT_22916 [Syncephalis pseudoplumigaleata]|eukprot:RKP25058.1 hypothetical protein SYNPS1DRAFT_22916 [Syncephalis pseudoplumigaleata]
MDDAVGGGSSPRLDNIPDIDEDTEAEDEMDQGRARADTAPSMAYVVPESSSNRNSRMDMIDASIGGGGSSSNAVQLGLFATNAEGVTIPRISSRRPSIVMPIDEMNKPALEDVAPFMFTDASANDPDNPVEITVIRGRKHRPTIDIGPGRLSTLQPSAAGSELLRRTSQTRNAERSGAPTAEHHEDRMAANDGNRDDEGEGEDVNMDVEDEDEEEDEEVQAMMSERMPQRKRPANSVHSILAGSTSLLANTIAVGRRRNRTAQQSIDATAGAGAGRWPQHFATLPARGNAASDESNRRVVITSSAMPRRTHNHGRPSLSIALQMTRNTITGGQGVRTKFSSTSTSNQPSGNALTLFDVMREEPDPNATLEPPPQAVELRSFWLMRCFERSITSGGYLTARLYVPRSIWMTTGVKLTAIDTKIQACERLRDRLEKMAAVDLEDADNALLVLDELDDELHNIQNQLARKLDYIKESRRPKSLGLGLKSMERMHANMTKDKVEDAAEYMDALVNLFRACQLLDHWLRNYTSRAASKEREHALQRLHRASDFMRSVICAFVIRDLGLLYDKYAKRIHEWIID